GLVAVAGRAAPGMKESVAPGRIADEARPRGPPRLGRRRNALLADRGGDRGGGDLFRSEWGRRRGRRHRRRRARDPARGPGPRRWRRRDWRRRRRRRRVGWG